MLELLNFYSFFIINEPKKLAQEWYRCAKNIDLLGTILVAPEGVNLSLCGKKENIEKFIKEHIITKTAIDPAILRRTKLKQKSHRKLKLKLKTEIVTSRFDKSQKLKKRNANHTYIKPDHLDALADDKDVLFVDLRNDYEFALGTFKNALCLPMNEFHDLPKLLDNLQEYKDKKLVTFCTGGVRCEKAIPLLEKQGFKAYQLHGGILHYLEKYGQREKNLWEGECFVFDDRVSVNTKLEQGSYEWCELCGQPSRSGCCVVCG